MITTKALVVDDNEHHASMAIILHTGAQEGYYADHQGDAFLTYPVAFSELFLSYRGV